MVKDAEAHAEEDRKFKELVETRNKADQLIHGAEKALKDLGDKVSGEDRAKVEAAVADLKSALSSDDKTAIEKKSEALAQASGAIAQQAYAQQAGAEGAAGAQANAGGSAGGKDDVLDAEFEEVKDKK
jgi:molecular chaperone DnaK